MANGLLLPTQFLSGGERLLHGKSVAAAVGAGLAGDWVRLDMDVHYGTWDRVAGWKVSSSLRVGFHWFDQREIADWGTVPYWDGDAPSWASPPTESELALCLCHADPRVRAAALDAGGAAAPLPLLLLRCADNDERVRGRAREVFAAAFAAVGDESARSLVALALRAGVRRHGRWARDAVLARTGGVREAAVRELLAGEGRQEADARMAGIRAGAEAGLLDADALYRIALTADRSGRERFEAIRGALAAGRDTAAQKRFLDFLARCEKAEVRIWALRYALSVRLPSTDDLAGLAVGHHDRNVRRLAARVVLEPMGVEPMGVEPVLEPTGADPVPELPGADAVPEPRGAGAVLDRLLDSPDSVVRGWAVGRLRAGGRSERLVPYLIDPSSSVRGLACRELRAAGGDPHARYRAWCADPETVTPAAVSGLAQYRDPCDGPLLDMLTRHADGAVRARAVGGLRRLGVLDAGALARYAADPDPRVVAVVLRGLRDDPAVMRALLGHANGWVRGTALTHLAHRHALGWEEALPFLSDPAKEASRAARAALRSRRSRIPEERLVALAAPGEAAERRVLAMELLGRSFEPAALVTALRLVDDPLPAVRAAARDSALRVLWDSDAARGDHADEIRALADRHAQRLVVWKAEMRERRWAPGRRRS
ncbi:hypothetical protein [Streptomyces sp. NPDC090022]|uniref:hypothetical protein n=1 Tax=Streptomyces sp. NPDC090022 TaxID=3365920 RepID=UPI0037FB41B1